MTEGEAAKTKVTPATVASRVQKGSGGEITRLVKAAMANNNNKENETALDNLERIPPWLSRLDEGKNPPNNS